MMSKLQKAFQAASDQFGLEIAGAAAEASVDAFNRAAIAGKGLEACEAAQLEAFAAELPETEAAA